MIIDKILITLSGLSFIIYGLSSLFSKKMISEFKRWGYLDHRLLLGTLQFLGGLGILLGLKFDILVPICSSSLMLLMLAAIGVRIKIGDRRRSAKRHR